MTGSLDRALGVLTTVTLLSILSSCSHSVPAPADTSATYRWSEAKELYASGDYLHALTSLDRLLDATKQYNSRALPMSMVLSAGVAEGYIELADNYALGARANKAKAPIFQRKAAEYRALANHMLLHFAETTKKMDLVEGDSVQLAFGPPKGTFAEPVAFSHIANGFELPKADEEAALQTALERGVLLAVCNTAGASNNLAKASELLQRGEFLVRRAKFMKAVADLLERELVLYSRSKLDDPNKMAMLHQIAQATLHDADASHTAMVMQVAGR